MPTSKELREQRAPLAVQIRKMADDGSCVNADGTHSEAWVKVNADYDALTKRIEIAERADAVESQQVAAVERRIDFGAGFGSLNDSTGRKQLAGTDGAVQMTADEARGIALSAWFKTQASEDLTEREIQACQLANFNPRRSQLALQLWDTSTFQVIQDQYRRFHHTRAKSEVMRFGATLGTGSVASGSALIPPETLIRNLEVNMLAYGGMRQAAESIRTMSGERMSWPTADDTSNTGVQLGESTTIGSSVDPSFGKVYWDAYKFSSKAILVPYELIQDSFVNLPAVLGDMLGERLGRITNTKFTTGTGAATCKGIVTAASSFSAASATAIAFDDIFGLEHSIDPAYRAQGCNFMMHDSILLIIRKLKDGQGRYLWSNGVQDGAPDRINGYPLTINQDMDSTVASGKKTILFGKLSNYKIRTVGEVRMYRLQERYRDTDQDAFIAFTREDGNLLTSATVPVKYLSH